MTHEQYCRQALLGLFIILCFLGLVSVIVSLDKTPLAADRSVAAAIYEARQDGEACKELNMNLYIWLRARGYHPDVQVGTLEGKGHLWLEMNGVIYDVTRPDYYGKLASTLKEVYKIDTRLQVK